METLDNSEKNRGGKCLTTIYKDSLTKLEFECAEGHRWKATPNRVKNADNWCPKCGIKAAAEKRMDSIEVYQELAKEKGGKLLSDIYVRSHKKMEWECAVGHRWKAPGHMIK